MPVWNPITHSDTTDLATKPASALFDAEHAPLEFVLDEHDLAVAAAGKHHRAAVVARLNAQPIKQKKARKAAKP